MGGHILWTISYTVRETRGLFLGELQAGKHNYRVDPWSGRSPFIRRVKAVDWSESLSPPFPPLLAPSVRFQERERKREGKRGWFGKWSIRSHLLRTSPASYYPAVCLERVGEGNSRSAVREFPRAPSHWDNGDDNFAKKTCHGYVFRYAFHGDKEEKKKSGFDSYEFGSFWNRNFETDWKTRARMFKDFK